MKRFTLSVMTAIGFLAGTLFVNAQTNYRCATNEMWQQAVEIDPSIVLKRQQMEEAIEQHIKSGDASRADNDEIRIIPVVFHIMHSGGTENISEAQIIDQIRILNEDFRRLNADAANTPSIFQPVAADSKIEFRIATKDPWGNCTNGITRTYTNRSFNFNNFAKSLISWPPDKYLNIWVCEFIEQPPVDVNNSGEVIGYAQFPLGLSRTDGVVLKHSFVGITGSASGNAFYAGRDATHEVGHWLNLIHIWGDTECGSDLCDDTPWHFARNVQCPAFPKISLCNPFPHEEMTSNYMDYTNGNCKNIFTQDQKKRMRAALDIARFTMWQQANLEATGTADPYVYSNTACTPKADFLSGLSPNLLNTKKYLYVCPGAQVYFKDNSTGSAATSWNWDFPGGTPSSSTLEKPVVVYNTPGEYHVTLTVSNGAGSSTYDLGGAIVVDNATGIYNPDFFQDFESSTSLWDWRVYNDDGGPAWSRTTRAGHYSGASMSIQNHESFSVTAPYSLKELITSSYNLRYLKTSPTPRFEFRLSYGQQYSGNEDTLRVYSSSNCGVSWTQIREIGSTDLAAMSAGFQPGNFAPSQPDQWGLVSIPLTGSQTGRPNVRFRFVLTTGILSNNLYIDDININGTVGIAEPAGAQFNFNAFPNPASESFTVNYLLNKPEDVIINLYDLQGRLITQIENKQQSPGAHEKKVDAASFNLASGVYVLKMITAEATVSQMLVYSEK